MFKKAANGKNGLPRGSSQFQEGINKDTYKGAMSSNPYGKVYCMDGADRNAARAAVEKVSKAYR